MRNRVIARPAEAQQPEDLVARARGGDLAAVEALWRGSVDRLNALCLRMTGNPALAEELTQESFIRAWQRLDSFRGESEFTSWLHQVAVNVVLTDRRAMRRREERETARGDLGQPRTPAPGLTLDLERAIALLPDRARAVFVLHDVEGYRHLEVARLLGIAGGTSKTQLHRARKLLREMLR